MFKAIKILEAKYPEINAEKNVIVVNHPPQKITIGLPPNHLCPKTQIGIAISEATIAPVVAPHDSVFLVYSPNTKIAMVGPFRTPTIPVK